MCGANRNLKPPLEHSLAAEYLYPESWFLHKLEETRQPLLKFSLSNIAKAEKASCLSKGSRKVPHFAQTVKHYSLHSVLWAQFFLGP